MTAALSLLIVLGLSFLVTRVFTAALALTGVSRPLARLQAISAFTGVGFTTTESERIVDHPVRRRLLTILMILGNAGVVTAVSTLLLSFVDVKDARDALVRGGIVAVGVLLLVLLARSDRVDRQLERAIEWCLARWTRLDVHDYVELLGLSGDYRVREMEVEPDDWVTDRRLDELKLQQEGISVLGIHRDGRYLGIPRGETEIQAGDRLVLYGRDEDMTELDERKRGGAGDASHRRAVESQQRTREAQQRREEMAECEEAREADDGNDRDGPPGGED